MGSNLPDNERIEYLKKFIDEFLSGFIQQTSTVKGIMLLAEQGELFLFPAVKSELEKGTMVCFTGTPCQISGLLNFLGKEYENLITIDMICKGVPSPKLWKKYVDFQEKKYKSKIKKVSFRKKTYGYHS